MVTYRQLLRVIFSLLVVCLINSSHRAFSQTQEKPKAPTPDDVVRVFTELVQTDVMVFDKGGRFVSGLTRDNFEVKVDGQVRPIQFFEQVNAGSANEEAQLAAARGATNTSGPKPDRVVPLDRGRTIFFYIDDFHLDLGGLTATRKIISDFVENQMGQNDQVAIASATGQIGFLQQLTGDRNVLQLALERLKFRSYTVTDVERPAMSEYEAMLIDNHDTEVFDFFVQETIRVNGGGISSEMAEGIVRGRAQAMLSQAALFNTNSLIGLERVIRIARDLPGRKVLFYLSNGFLLQNKRGDATTQIRSITSAATKSGVVIYSIDTGGLASPKADLSIDRPFDPSGILTRASHGESFALQDGLNALARDTGGRPFFNTNDYRPAVTEAIKETAVYYLLAWKPDSENRKPGRFRNVQVYVIGKPNLVVRVSKGFFDVEPAPAKVEETVALPPEEENKLVASKLRTAIAAPYPLTGFPLQLGINYFDAPGKGPTLATSILMPGEFLTFGPRNGEIQAVVDLAGVYFDDKGKPTADFYERLVTTAPSAEEAQNYHGDISYTNTTNLTPGLYQVRVAVRDSKSGRSGSVHGWIEIPDLSKNEFTTSSLLLGERRPNVMTTASSSTDPTPVNLSPGHRFQRDSTMRLLVFAYNASISEIDQKPDLAVQVQIIRDDQPVVTTALRKIPAEGVADLKRLPYAAEVPLTELQTGHYILRVTIIDRVSKKSTSRQTHFDIY